jgi:UDP-N-acetylmuramate--alanine ligase
MHVYFSGIGGAGIGPLALIAKQAGYVVSGSDAQNSEYIKYLTSQGIDDIHIGQSREDIQAVHTRNPIDWFVYSSALPKTDANHPELVFCQQNGIKTSKRDEFLNKVINDKSLRLIAVAGTHGKTTTTAMLVWLFKQLGIPVSYSVGGKISFGEMGEYDPKSQYFVYEADEYDRNFLSFRPYLALITGLDWDHPDIFPSRESYNQAFADFLNQSKKALVWEADRKKLDYSSSNLIVLNDADPTIDLKISLSGQVNRKNAWLVVNAFGDISDKSPEELIGHINKFPGLSRRFEEISPGLFSDYAHTPAKIRGALQLAQEVGGDNVVVVYEGLHNTRQHFIKEELGNLFDEVKQLYIVPSFLAREDKNLTLLAPRDLLDSLSTRSRGHAKTAELDDLLADHIRQHLGHGDLVLCFSAGSGGKSLDHWLRRNFST